MRESGPLMPGTVNPNTNLSWDTTMWTAAAVVKPDTRVSDRYTTIKPTCRTPMASCTGQKHEEKRSLVSTLGTCRITGMGWYRDTIKSTWKIPIRKVTEEATRTLCSSWDRPSKLVRLAAGPSSGTRRVTTAPTIRLRTGKEPAWRWVWRCGKTPLRHITLSLISLCQNYNFFNFSKQATLSDMFMLDDRKPVLLLLLL